MSGRRTFRLIVTFATAFLFAVSGAHSSLAATRGEAIHAIVTALGLPEWPGGRHFSDLGSDHPFSRSIETAAALGILHPTEQFYPDIEASRAEAVMFSLQAMGLRHEAAILQGVAPKEHPGIPVYIAPYLSLAEELQPALPEEFLSDPRGTVSPQDLYSLSMWLRECRRALSWRREISSGGSTLVLSRDHVGTPPSEWGVVSEELGSEEEAASLARRISDLGIPAIAQPLGWMWIVKIGPFAHYFDAWETMARIPAQGLTVAPFSQSPGRALYYAALGFDPAAAPPRIVTAASISGRKLPLDVIAANAGAEGAINGGFFGGSRIVGTLVVDSRPVSGPYGDRSAAGWSADGTRILFGRGDFRTVLTIGERDFPVSTVNSIPPQGGIGIFTPEVSSYVTGAPADGWELTVKGGKAAGVRHSASSNHFVTGEGFLVISRGYSSQFIQQVRDGTPVSFRAEWMEEGFVGMDYVMQAGPMLVRDGAVQDNSEGFGPRTLSVPHPRSILGFDGKRVWFIVVDGRDPWHSNGLTFGETAGFARMLGLTHALNLDGGGSSSIWWKGRTVTAPPGGTLRPIPYALVF